MRSIRQIFGADTDLSTWIIRAGCVVTLAVFFLVLPPFCQDRVFEIDEGYNSVQALLHAKGFRFYSDMWSDQPSLIYLVLDEWFRLVGASLWRGRLLILLFSVLLLWNYHHAVRLRSGRTAAALAVVFLLATRTYLRLSLSIMQAIPSLAFAMLTISLLTHYRRRLAAAWLVPAGLAMALSMQMKLMTVLLFPVFLLDMLTARPKSTLKDITSATIWTVTALCGFALVALHLGEDFYQMVAGHLASQHGALASSSQGWRALCGFFLSEWHLSPFIAAALWFGATRKRGSVVLPMAWLFVYVAAMTRFRPLWSHYQLLVAIPLAWLAGLGAAWLLDELETGVRTHPAARFLAPALCLLIFTCILPARFLFLHRELRDPGSLIDTRVVGALREFRDFPGFVPTVDGQTFLFMADLLPPPELASTPSKRKANGEYTDQTLLNVVLRYEPAQMLMERLTPFSPKFKSFVQERYVARLVAPFYMQFVRRDVARQVAPDETWLANPFRTAVLIPNPYALRGMATVFATEERWDDVVVLLEEALRLNPHHPGIHQNLGIAFLRIQEPARAEAHLREALRANEMNPDLLTQLGLALSAQNRHGEAVSAYRSAIAAQPNPKTYFHLGCALAANGQRAEALVTFEMTVRADPNHAGALNNAAWLMATGADHHPQLAVALEKATRACEITQYQEPSFMDTLATVLALSGQRDGAAQMAERGATVAEHQNRGALARAMRAKAASYRRLGIPDAPEEAAEEEPEQAGEEQSESPAENQPPAQ